MIQSNESFKKDVEVSRVSCVTFASLLVSCILRIERGKLTACVCMI